MKGWIRWTGLLAFTVAIVLLAGIWWLATPLALHYMIEHIGSRTLGAKVEVASVTSRFNPLGLEIRGFSAADPEAPMHNLTEFAEARASVDGLRMLMGQVIIEELEISGLKFNTPRQSSGALPVTPTETVTETVTEDDTSLLSEIQVDLPPVDDILAREPLHTTQIANEVETLYEQEEEAITTRLMQLPDNTALGEYEKRLKTITEGEIATLNDYTQRKERLDALRADLRRDKQDIATTYTEIEKGVDKLTGQLDVLKRAPAEDWKQLTSKYSLSSEGAANFSSLLFGSTAKEWFNVALKWYAKVQPFMAAASTSESKEQAPQRATGRYVHFPSREPLPDFLIRRAVLQAQLPFAPFEVRITDITHQPEIIGRPTRLALQALQNDHWQRFTIDGEINHGEANKKPNTFTLKISDYRLHNFRLSGGSTFPLTLADATVQINGNVHHDTDKMKGKISGEFTNARFVGSSTRGLAAEITAALSSIDRFQLSAMINGTLRAPNLEINSDIDDTLRQALSARLKARQQIFEAELREKLNARMEERLQPYQKRLQALQEKRTEIEQKRDKIDAMLKQQLADFKEAQRDKINEKTREQKDKINESADKLLDKLKKGFGR